MIAKYRAFLKANKLMYKVLCIDIAENKALIEHGDMRGYAKYPDEIVLMQSTGLKDNNGVEIFEGDIVRHCDYENSFEGAVRLSPFGIYGYDGYEYYGFIDIADDDTMTADCIVVGNEYENMELL